VTNALTEIQAAAAAGFTRWVHFQRARKAGLFPEPVRELPGVGPIWSQQRVDRWLGVVAPAAESSRGEEEALRRVHEQARRQTAQP
jgi:hypothetical protein